MKNTVDLAPVLSFPSNCPRTTTGPGGLMGEKLSKAPRGYPADHPDLELLRLKAVTVMHTVTDKEVVSPSVVQTSAAVFKTMKPFLDYLGSILPPTTAI